MFTAEVERMGPVNQTEKGFIAQYLVYLADGSRRLAKIFSKDAKKLIESGNMSFSGNFFFAE